MQKTNEGVSLSDKEFEVTAMRDLLFDQGDSTIVAARTALERMSGVPSKGFVEWLSEGGLTKKDGQIVAVEEVGDDEQEVPATEPQPAAS
jgi:hypothetical protein